MLIFLFLGPIKECFSQCSTPGDYFLKFFDDDIISDIIYQTNLYAVQHGRRFAPMTERELYGFLGVNIIMGYHKLPSWTHYWNQDHGLNVPYVGDVMSRDRFGQILSHLHVNDNTALPDNNKDKLFKIRPLITKLNSNFMKLYDVRKVVSIDESMILFKGRHSIKQYNPMKPIKWGYKLWVRADLDGYISKFDVYQGKHKSEELVHDAYDGIGLGEKVVVNFSKDLFGKHHQVYFDNYFYP